MTGDRSNQEKRTINSTNQQRTILLVEDCEIDRKMYRRYLVGDREHDYLFVEAETGAEALKLCAELLPDLVLLDYLLPDMDGLEWLSTWQQEYGEHCCPVIVLTGQGSESIAVQFIKLGAANYFIKGHITAEKLRFAVSKEIALREEKQNFTTTIQLQTEQIQKTSQSLQERIDRCEVSERLIRTNEERLRRAIDNAPIPMMIHAEDGEVLQVNQTWTEISGYTKEEISTISQWTAKAYEEERERVAACIEHLYQSNGRIDEGEFAIRTAAGEHRIWDFSSAPLGKSSDGRRLVISIAKDVTKIRQAEIALQQSEAKFRNTFEQAAVGIAHVSLDGKWLMVNQKLCQIIGYPEAELLQTTFQEITYAEDLEKDLNFVRQILVGEIDTYSLEKRYVRKDHSLVWINLTVSLVRNEREPDYFISVIEDISDRKRLELAQKKTLQRLSNLHQLDKAIVEAQQPKAIATIAINGIQQLLSCQRVSIVTFNTKQQTATVLVAQGKAKQTLGTGSQTPLEVWQALIDKLQPSENYIVGSLEQFPQLSAAIPTLADSELNCLVCFPLKVKNQLLGTLKLWIADIRAVTTEELITVREISIQVAIALQQANLLETIQNYASELEIKVRERTAQLEEINQELKAFSYSISHDLKAPLRAIQGFAMALQEDYGESLDDLGREYTERLAISAQQMEQLIQDLLVYSRLSRADIQKQTVSLTLAIHRAIEDLEPIIREVGAEIKVEQLLLEAIGNQTILQQIINNLLSNALKFISPEAIPQIIISTERRENYVRIWIEDNGIGIEPQHQERIFQVFERLHGSEAYPGTGIGLAIVKKGIERLSGKFGVESAIDRGSRFWIELPFID